MHLTHVTSDGALLEAILSVKANNSSKGFENICKYTAYAGQAKGNQRLKAR